jgi:hypothetical protein
MKGSLGQSWKRETASYANAGCPGHWDHWMPTQWASTAAGPTAVGQLDLRAFNEIKFTKLLTFKSIREK